MLFRSKASTGAEAAEGIALLREQLERIGMEITTEKGDYNEYV